MYVSRTAFNRLFKRLPLLQLSEIKKRQLFMSGESWNIGKESGSRRELNNTKRYIYSCTAMKICHCLKCMMCSIELMIVQVRTLSATLALFISTIDLVLYRLSPLFSLIRSSHRPVAHEDGQNKA
ncbi:hypothetical protein J6590_097974 [Homalodisca vitripennis]|nr:hypothetical protein J6590_097974 [Homalodisca vitripennis]